MEYLKFRVIGVINFINKSNIPELLKAPMATNKPTNVGKIFITISIPSLAPSKKTSKTFILSLHPYIIIIKIVKGIAKLDI